MTSFKTIIPAPLRTNDMVNLLVKTAEKQGKLMVKDFNKTTKTWTGEKPVFQAITKMDNRTSTGFPNNITLVVSPTDDSSKGAQVWNYLNKGTPYPRHALMTKGFVPKTRKGQLNSWKGKGGLLIVSKKIKLPGIKARKWDKALQDKWAVDFAKAMEDAMQPMAGVSGHGVSFGGMWLH